MSTKVSWWEIITNSTQHTPTKTRPLWNIRAHTINMRNEEQEEENVRSEILLRIQSGTPGDINGERGVTAKTCKPSRKAAFLA